MNKGVPRTRKKSVVSLDFSRDIYGFMVRPQHLEKYKEYASIYKEEEAERSDRWEHFLQAYNESAESFHQDQEYDKTSLSGIHLQDQTELKGATSHELGRQYSEIARSVQTWGQLRSSLWVVKQGLSRRPWKKASLFPLKPTDNQLIHQANDEDSDDEFYDADRSDAVSDHQASDLSDSEFPNVTNKFEEESCSWREELQFLVRGGVPMALRGELWQVFVGTKERRIEGHYTALLKQSAQNSDDVAGLPNIEKWTNQIEKDLPRTFPGHPALDKDGRNALRRLLTAYARHNPDVGYCQAMNFFAALLLLLMPEENAFWTLTAIIGDYFEGYYSEKMMESQVDQLAFQDLVQEYFPKLASHLDMLGVQVACVSGPWFLSIFVNVLPWESVLRVWDVLLFEGNRTMLFRTALALMDMHAPTLMSARDAGDAISLLQSTVGSTFDSSQLVLTACMGYQLVDQAKLEQLRTKHRPTVVATFHERALDLHLDIDEEQIDIIDLQEQVLWLKNELCRALEEKKAANLRAEELELALMEMVKEDNRRLLSAKIEELEDEVSSLREAINGKMEQEQAMVEVMLRMEQEQKVTEDARQFAEQDAEAQRHAANLLQQKYEEAMDALAAMEKRAVMAETMLEATLQYQALDIGQPNNRRLASTPKEEEHLKKNWSLTSPRASDVEASKTTSPTSADMVNRSSSGSAPESPDESASRKQGLFSRISWRDKNKGRSGSPLSQNSEIISNGIVAKEIHQNGNGVHATEIEDVS